MAAMVEEADGSAIFFARGTVGCQVETWSPWVGVGEADEREKEFTRAFDLSDVDHWL